MSSEVSKFGKKFSEETGIMSLMDDLGKAMSGSGDKAMFGGGNPAMIPEVRDIYMKRVQQIAEDPKEFAAAFTNYDAPQGNAAFIDSLVKYLNDKFGWGIDSDNIAITPGSQNGFFSLFNMLAGEQEDGSVKKIMFPLVPEYIGYADQGLHNDMFVGLKPQIELIGNHEFKYHVDLDNLVIGDDVAALCVSRPSNPTGNVISENEVEALREKAEAAGIPLILDNAYGLPFPGVIDADTMPKWDDSIIYSMSLSKVGLPAARTGIFVASKDIARRLTNITAIIALANTNVGQRIVQPMLDDGSLDALCVDHIQPFYDQKADYMRKVITEQFDDDWPYRLHSHDGSYFFWLWLNNMPISSGVLYERLKKRDVVVVSGEYFFPGFTEQWDHTKQCLRLNFSRPKDEVDRGMAIMAEEIRQLYS